jgi:hypothetical protein
MCNNNLLTQRAYNIGYGGQLNLVSKRSNRRCWNPLESDRIRKKSSAEAGASSCHERSDAAVSQRSAAASPPTACNFTHKTYPDSLFLVALLIPHQISLSLLGIACSYNGQQAIYRISGVFRHVRTRRTPSGYLPCIPTTCFCTPTSAKCCHSLFDISSSTVAFFPSSLDG